MSKTVSPPTITAISAAVSAWLAGQGLDPNAFRLRDVRLADKQKGNADDE
ncbi:MAG: hypothetical protein AAGF84_06185 [Planctomycetota bacterium]